MSPVEPIPDLNRIRRIQNAIREATEPEVMLDLDVVHRGMAETDDQVVANTNADMNQTRPDDMVERVLNMGRIQLTRYDQNYERIFEYREGVPSTAGLMSRRSAREANDPFKGPEDRDLQAFMFKWLQMCTLNPEPEYDHKHPTNEEWLDDIINYLPERLDLQNWVGEDMRIMASVTLGCQKHELQQWNELLDPIRRNADGTITHPAPGHILFIGRPIIGRFVWIRGRGFPIPTQQDWNRAMFHLRRAEEGLVALSRRIAREVCHHMYHSFAYPQGRMAGRPVLTRRQLGQAVREILGEKWFDLPLDLDGSLRNWSIDSVMLPQAEITNWRYPFIGDPRPEPGEEDDGEP